MLPSSQPLPRQPGMVARATRSATATAAVLLLLLSILPALPCEERTRRDARTDTVGGRKPPPPAVQPAALPKLVLGAENCVDMFGAGVGGGGEKQPNPHKCPRFVLTHRPSLRSPHIKR